MKKAQAAMEFLMTYGWAVLVVLSTIGALAYFGVLSPSKYLPETCLFSQGISCLDYKVTSSNIEMYLMNGYGQDIDVYNISVDTCDVYIIGEKIENGESFVVDFGNCSNGASGDQFKEEICWQG